MFSFDFEIQKQVEWINLFVKYKKIKIRVLDKNILQKLSKRWNKDYANTYAWFRSLSKSIYIHLPSIQQDYLMLAEENRLSESKVLIFIMLHEYCHYKDYMRNPDKFRLKASYQSLTLQHDNRPYEIRANRFARYWVHKIKI